MQRHGDLPIGGARAAASGIRIAPLRTHAFASSIQTGGIPRYLYRGIDKHGEAIDFLLTAKRDLDAAKRFFRRMLKDGPLLSPDRIGTDGAGTYPGAIAAARKKGLLSRDLIHHVTKHLQQGIESDHFRVKQPMPREVDPDFGTGG